MQFVCYKQAADDKISSGASTGYNFDNGDGSFLDYADDGSSYLTKDNNFGIDDGYLHHHAFAYHQEVEKPIVENVVDTPVEDDLYTKLAQRSAHLAKIQQDVHTAFG